MFGKNGVGKSATIANLCGQGNTQILHYLFVEMKITLEDIPPSHVETPGIQVIGCYWPAQVVITHVIQLTVTIVKEYESCSCI